MSGGPLRVGESGAVRVEQVIRRIVIVGGGSAGWLTAALLASTHGPASGVQVTVIESPDVPTIGVGEGTWPSMRDTLRRIGVGEADFVRACEATFKQGSLFAGWVDGQPGDAYAHPFVLPQGYLDADLVAGWLEAGDVPYAELVSFQPHLCAAGCAPKQFATPEYAAVANYAYHLDAARFGHFLREHCVQRLGVRHLPDHVEGVLAAEDGDISALATREHGELPGDLFVDCTGTRALLLDGHYRVPFTPVRDVLFNDRAVAVQIPHASPDAPIACQTVATAQRNGWVWDIGLPSRRGIGHVYSSAHQDENGALATLDAYVRAQGATMDPSAVRRIAFEPGYRRQAWHRNCVAIGLSAGFVEPLEASSLALVELAATAVADQLPATREAMALVARRFNEAFAYRWERVVEFLKLHYVLSRRDGDYWRAHRDPATLPEPLRERLALWRHQPPSRYDLVRVDEVFPSASYHYVMYGMGWRPAFRPGHVARRAAQAVPHFREAAALARRMRQALPTHRALVEHIAHHGLPTI